MTEQPAAVPPVSDVNPPAAPIPEHDTSAPADANAIPVPTENPTPAPATADASPSDPAPANAGTASVPDLHDNDNDDNPASVIAGEQMIPMSSVESIIKDMQLSLQTRQSAVSFAIQSTNGNDIDAIITNAGKIEKFLVDGGQGSTV